MTMRPVSRIRVRSTLAACVLLVPAIATLIACSAWSRNPVDFSRDIRPIFNQNCMSCHGGVRQKGGVSFMFREEALGKGKSGLPTIVPGDPGASELIKRVLSQDPETRMPYHATPLQPEQIELLRRWIKEGAKWSDYWAFVPPRPQPLPTVKRTDWVRQPLDRFVLARLQRESLQPSPEAEKSALLRRVSLDLTGLPPTIQEQKDFLDDHSPNAYDKQVDRLLASPAYGERWASMWLDLARYADSYGYEADNLRLGVWVYRDWVIDAFNRNLPYDEFVTKQLAGDLLPDATFGDRIATSFHRQTPNNQEGGTDDEEFRLVAVMDRVATTWSVLNGLTMNCVQCHSHPYDPIRHAEYYKSLAFFNTSRDADRDDDFPNLRFPKKKLQLGEVAQMQQEIGALLHQVVESDRELVKQIVWTQIPITSAGADEVPALLSRLPADEKYLASLRKEKGPAKQKAEDISNQVERIRVIKERLAKARARGTPARTFHLDHGEALAEPSTPSQSIYELVAPLNAPSITAIRVEVPPIDEAQARHSPEDGFVVDSVRAWRVSRNGGKQRLRALCFLQDSEENLGDAVTPPFDNQVRPQRSEIEDGFSSNPKLFRPRWIVAVLLQPLHPTNGDQVQISLKQTREIDYKPVPIKRVRLSVTDDARLTDRGRDHTRRSAISRLLELEQRLSKISAVNVPVMSEELPYERRTTLEFERGNFLNKVGDDLEPNVPQIFPKLPDGQPRNRLTLARWFFSPGQPLTARVAVNRYWEQLFGTGIVETLENFGSVGEAPSHPELLDWLALHFQNDLHWDMKALLREIVTSATYRQSAVCTPALRDKDPRNRLLARGPQQRLTAEMVRDQALVASGLLSHEIGGPPVMPPQPAGIWNSVYNGDKWVDATGPNRYRRALYTFVKRTSGYPSFLIFDSSDRATSLPRRIPTNTPLQALVTLNDPVYDEAAAALALRAYKDFGASGTPKDRLRDEAILVLSRDPTPQELTVLQGLYEKTVAGFRSGTGKPAVLKLASQPALPGARLSEQEFAALKAVGVVLLNLDAALTR